MSQVILLGAVDGHWCIFGYIRVIVVITTYEYVTSGSFGERGVRRDVSNGGV